MKYYDCCVRAQDFGKAAAMARKLGWAGACFLLPWDNVKPDLEKARNAAKEVKDFDIALGVEIITHNPGQISGRAEAARKAFEIIAVRGGTPELNRAAVECPEVDILLDLETHDHENAFNHVLAALGKKNNVAVAFSISSMVASYKGRRASVFSKLVSIAAAVKRGGCPFVMTSGALSEWDIQPPSALEAFGRNLGLDPKEGLSGKQIAENRKRLSGKWVMPGVEVE